MTVKSDQKPVRTDSDSHKSCFLDHWSLLKSHLFWAYDRELKIDASFPYNPWPTAAWLIRKGWVTLEFDDGKEHYKEGMWVFPRLKSGKQRFSPNSHILSVRFQFEWPGGENILDRSRTISLHQDQIAELTEISEELVDYVKSTFPSNSSSQTFLQGTLTEYLALRPRFDRWLECYYQTLDAHTNNINEFIQLHEKVRESILYMDSRAVDKPFFESELAHHVGTSSSHLHRLFVKEMNITPIAYWNKKRMTIACSRLTGTRQSIKAIAYELGFSSPENFSHWFRVQTHKSPRLYRRETLHSAKI